MAYFITRQQSGKTYYLSGTVTDRRVWSAKKSRAVIFYFTRPKLDLYIKEHLSDLEGQFDILIETRPKKVPGITVRR